MAEARFSCLVHRMLHPSRTPVMRQHHVAGEKMFVDYAGATLEVIDPKTGEIRQAQLFVAALGASNFTFAEASWTQGLSDWIGSHCPADCRTMSPARLNATGW